MPNVVEIDLSGLPCRVEDPDIWFADDVETIAYARTQCGLCPLTEQCLQGALDRKEAWGVWGGEFVSKGIVRIKRNRGRPRTAQDGTTSEPVHA